MGNVTLYLVLTVIVSAFGGLLFGYDVGVISGIIEMGPFKETFQWTSPAQLGFVVSSLTLGCFIGSLMAAFLCDYVGRKRAILLGAMLFIVGGALQTAASSLIPLYLGRFIAGLSIGIMSMAVPLYISEMSPKEHRGFLISAQQLAITIGILVSFLINLACHSIPGNASWRVPFAIQVALAGLMAIGLFFLPMSPRWLLSKERTEEASRNLIKVRGGETASVHSEYDEMLEAVRLEKEIGNGSWGELVGNGMWKRVLIGVVLQMFQQLTGINAVMYYAPSILKKAGFMDLQISLLATAGTGVVNVLMTLPGMFLVDRLGRRPLLISGAVLMAATMTVLGTMIAIYGPDFTNASIPYVCLIMMYLFVASFAYSWGPIGWVYPSEIYPLRIRAKATSITTASNWLFNFIVGFTVPELMATINWGLYLIFAGFGLLMCVWVLVWVPETKGRSLEEIDRIFGQEGASHAAEAELKKNMAVGGH